MAGWRHRHFGLFIPRMTGGSILSTTSAFAEGINCSMEGFLSKGPQSCSTVLAGCVGLEVTACEWISVFHSFPACSVTKSEGFHLCSQQMTEKHQQQSLPLRLLPFCPSSHHHHLASKSVAEGVIEFCSTGFVDAGMRSAGSPDLVRRTADRKKLKLN